MQVPDHLVYDGSRRTTGSPYARADRRAQRHSFNENLMTVPDKITVSEDGRLIAHPAQPNEVLRDKVGPPVNNRVSTVPNTLTANHYASDGKPANSAAKEQQRPDSALEASNQMNSSLAVEADPIRELKNVRRQLGRLATRVLELEDENQRRSTREYGLWAVLAGSVALLAFLFGKR